MNVYHVLLRNTYVCVIILNTLNKNVSPIKILFDMKTKRKPELLLVFKSLFIYLFFDIVFLFIK